VSKPVIDFSMNKFSKPELIVTRRCQTRSRRAFTLTELLVVMAMTALLATVLLSVAFSTQQGAFRAECVSNLRQIGVGLNLYSTEANGYVPICGWANPSIGGNPWQTYQIARCSSPGSTNYTLGFENLGLLFRTKVIPDGKTFYCPSTALISSIFSYSYYTGAPTGWPASSTSDFNAYIRAGYNYYPQLRATERINDPTYGTVILPKLTSTSVQLEFGFATLVTDLINGTTQLSHLASGSVAGLNALFPDGRVVFQTARNHNTKGSRQTFDPTLWAGTGPGNDPTDFRIIMNGWMP
jgi:prepilin-type N-terminal cleavage/methylation domain-containing protein